MKAVLLDQSTFSSLLSWNELAAQVDEFHCYGETVADNLYEHVADADIIITNKVKLFQHELEQLPRVKLICIAATGLNNIDINAAQALGIAVKNVTNYSTSSVAAQVMSFILNFSTQQFNHVQDVRNGHWSKSTNFCLQNHVSFSLQGKVLGIVGYGAIGKTVEKLANTFGMRVLVANSFNQVEQQAWRIPLNDCLQQSDFVSLHCPLTAQTHHLMNAKRLAYMSSQAYLINTARGGLIDESALANALVAGKLAGAGLDVLNQEPPCPENNLLQINHPQLLITPHVAWATIESQQCLVAKLVENISKWKSEVNGPA